jgi:hypothetical protein
MNMLFYFFAVAFAVPAIIHGIVGIAEAVVDHDFVRICIAGVCAAISVGCGIGFAMTGGFS